MPSRFHITISRCGWATLALALAVAGPARAADPVPRYGAEHRRACARHAARIDAFARRLATATGGPSFDRAVENMSLAVSHAAQQQVAFYLHLHATPRPIAEDRRPRDRHATPRHVDGDRSLTDWLVAGEIVRKHLDREGIAYCEVIGRMLDQARHDVPLPPLGPVLARLEGDGVTGPEQRLCAALELLEMLPADRLPGHMRPTAIDSYEADFSEFHRKTLGNYLHDLVTQHPPSEVRDWYSSYIGTEIPPN